MKKSLFVAAIAAISLVACKKGEATTETTDSTTVTTDSTAVAPTTDSTAVAPTTDSTAAKAGDSTAVKTTTTEVKKEEVKK